MVKMYNLNWRDWSFYKTLIWGENMDANIDVDQL